MSHRILLTGASGYIGGTILARLAEANLPPYEEFFALTRTSEQSEAVKQYGVKPLVFDSFNQEATTAAIVENKITIVFELHAASNSAAQQNLIRALGKVKEQTGHEVHFLHSTGAKLFSTHAGLDGKPLSDTDPNLYEIHKAQATRTTLQMSKNAVDANNTVVELSEAKGVESYILAPCIVYGKGEGFGNKISIQTVAVVKAAKALGKVYRVDTGRPIWPVCHVIDTATYYLDLLRAILRGEKPGSGKQGYYLASPGSVAWGDIYDAFAKSLVQRRLIKDATVELADDAVIERIAVALKSPKEAVPFQIGGQCGFIADHGKQIGWKPKYNANHIIETADEEVALILEYIS